MGKIRHISEHERVHALKKVTNLLGRSETCDVWLPHGEISREHASLTWTREGWSLKDLQSSNGTYIGEGGHLEAAIQAPVLLEAGDVFSLGGGRCTWTLLSDARPPAMAIAAEGTCIEEGEDRSGLSLPGGLRVWSDGERWLAGAPASQVRSGQQHRSGGRLWRLILPEPDDPTHALSLIPGISVRRDIWLTLTTEGPGRVRCAVRHQGVTHDLMVRSAWRLLWVLSAKPGQWMAQGEVLSALDLSIGQRQNLYNHSTRFRQQLHEVVGLRTVDAELILQLRQGELRLNLSPERVQREGR